MADTVQTDNDAPLSMDERMEEVKKRAKKVSKRTFTDVPAPIKVNPGHELSHERAAAVIREKKLREQKKKQQKWDEDSLHYVECPDEDCQGPAIWVWGKPNGVIPAERWESAYKPKAAAWYSGSLPYCQCCKQRTGAERPARVFGVWRDGRMEGFSVNPRFLREAPEELKALFNTKE